ncbi:TonB-dependent receptor [Massilia atriviolacea]|uniref:TonB-dependent receptor n=1 Tax=Massilia atriviolacea TaxID=2495579 RepID=A0A430HDP6_9BURK|nr:TonB-dependent receptor [Massilia atriviolacea]RSZ55621.1 TonB-dependent receptor [Massilia atriviolacea]
MMKPTVLSLSLGAMFAAGGGFAGAAFAQDGQPMQRVEITGSSIKRIQSETANPLSIIKADEFIKQGLTTAQEALSRIPSNQSTMGSGNVVGGNSSGLPTGGQASADLRGLGGDKTLVLLNGRRLANHPYDSSSVDLNMIPLSALDRVEVLRDGASAIYGTDAIGGVINFITKRSVTTTTITGELVRPRKDGGDEERVNLSSGFGNLDKDGFNVFGVVDWHKQESISSQQREFSKTGIVPSRGLNLTSGTTFPGNFYDAAADKSGNPGWAAGCNPPFSVPNAAGICRQDYTRQIDSMPDQEQLAVFARGSMKLGADHLASLEFLHSQNDVTSRTAPPPQTGLIMTNTSKYYPKSGVSGGPLSINWRPTEAGQRTIDSQGKADRVVLGMEGVLSGWDYKGGIAHSISKSSEDFVGGYVADASFAAGVANGILNPFALQDAAGKAYLDSTALRGRVQSAEVKNTAFDFKASRDIMAMGGGQMAVAVGTEIRRETADFNVNRAIAGQASSSGLSGSLSKSGSRNIQAVFTELNLPFTKELEIQLAARYDRYSDVGNTTNPKIGLRYQPMPQLLVRGSASTGFRAPTLFEKNGPPSRNDTNDSYNDPILCPGGKPQPGSNPLRDCDLQQFKLQGGNINLKPEKSKSFSFGAVIEPIPSVTIAADYWNIQLKDKIAALPEQTIYGNYEKYKALFLRFPDGSPNAIENFLNNLGEVKTDGVDLSATLRLPRTSFGNFTVTMDGTYVHKYDYQNERNGEFIHNVGRYADMAPVFRWQHTAALNWSNGPWGVNLSQSFKSSYQDQNQVADEFKHKVEAYSLLNLSGSYSGIQGLTLTAGLKNLLDEQPPFSNQGTLFQKGYDPRFSDPIGRAVYLRASYAF